MKRLIETQSGDFRVEVEDGIAHVILGAPGVMPTTSAQGHGEIGRIWAALSEASDVRSILVRSVGKGFCAGGTLELVETMLAEESSRLRVMNEARALVQGMIECDKPIVSAINGAAVGAGAALALLADVSVAARNAKVIDGHTRLGVAAGDHAAVIWPLLCGLAKAKYHLLLSETVSGAEAERIGLVSLAVDAAELESTTLSIAQRLAQASPSAVGFTKRTLNHWLRAAWPAFEHSLALEILGFSHADAREGLNALKDKRAPSFAR